MNVRRPQHCSTQQKTATLRGLLSPRVWHAWVSSRGNHQVSAIRISRRLPSLMMPRLCRGWVGNQWTMVHHATPDINPAANFSSWRASCQPKWHGSEVSVGSDAYCPNEHQVSLINTGLQASERHVCHTAKVRQFQPHRWLLYIRSCAYLVALAKSYQKSPHHDAHEGWPTGCQTSSGAKTAVLCRWCLDWLREALVHPRHRCHFLRPVRLSGEFKQNYIPIVDTDM